MKTMKKLAILLGFFGMCCLFGHCTKEDTLDDTVILLGKESYVIPMMEMIPDSLQDKFITQMGNPPEGFIPPNIEGEYRISEKQFCQSNFVDLMDHQDMHLRITNQHNRVATVEFHEGETIRTDTAFVMGSGRRFTLYMTEVRSMSFYADFTITKESRTCISAASSLMPTMEAIRFWASSRQDGISSIKTRTECRRIANGLVATQQTKSYEKEIVYYCFDATCSIQSFGTRQHDSFDGDGSQI